MILFSFCVVFVPTFTSAQTTSPRPSVDCSLLTATQARGLPCAAPIARTVTAPPLTPAKDCADLNPYADPDRALACITPSAADTVPTFRVGSVYAYGYDSVQVLILGVSADVDGVQVVTVRWVREGTVTAFRTPPTPGGATVFRYVGEWR